MDPSIEGPSHQSPKATAISKKQAALNYDDDNLHDDIEDKNASFSEYSVTKAQST